MVKYLGYADQLALEADADGNVTQWYYKGDDIPSIDPVQQAWLVATGYTFDPMPTTEESQVMLQQAFAAAPAGGTTGGTEGGTPPA